MKNLNIFISILLITGLCFWWMSIISEDNRYSSVRKYTKPKLDTLPPVIEFSNYQNGQIVSANTIDVQVKVTDNITPSEQIIIEWAGERLLDSQFTPIVVTAKDAAGNIGSAYIIIEKSNESPSDWR